MTDGWEMADGLPVGVVHGDCVAVFAALPADSIDSIVCDPPYGLEFMGREWDTYRVDPRSKRWSDASGSAGSFGQTDRGVLPSFAKRKTTNVCEGCGKRDAFRNPHASCPAAVWRAIPVDVVNVELRAYQNWTTEWAAEAYRVAKPGAYMLAFGGTRTYHRLASGIEDAGWEVRDCLVWGYASGFPKGLDVSKAIDQTLGAERQVTREATRPYVPGEAITFDARPSKDRERRDEPATDEARQYVGWNTALKPSWEPIVLARKPLIGSVAANVLRYGTGALNIDGTRIPMGDDDREKFARGAAAWVEMSERRTGGVSKAADIYGTYGIAANPAHDLGRYPANTVLTDPIFDGQYPATVVGGGEADEDLGGGGYSRFFLVSKASRADREPLVPGDLRAGDLQTMNDGANGHDDPIRRLNTHPTVKPVLLMQHLIRLVTPPGGIVCDPFLGSGTTGVAAEAEGFRWFGIEREADSVAIARTRLLAIDRGLGLDVPAPLPRPKASAGHWPTERGDGATVGAIGHSGQHGLPELYDRPTLVPLPDLPTGYEQATLFDDDPDDTPAEIGA